MIAFIWYSDNNLNEKDRIFFLFIEYVISGYFKKVFAYIYKSTSVAITWNALGQHQLSLCKTFIRTGVFDFPKFLFSRLKLLQFSSPPL